MNKLTETAESVLPQGGVVVSHSSTASDERMGAKEPRCESKRDPDVMYAGPDDHREGDRGDRRRLAYAHILGAMAGSGEQDYVAQST